MKKLIGAGLLAGALMAGAAGIAGPASAEPVGSGHYYYPSGSKGDQSVVAYYNDLTTQGIGVDGYSGADRAGAYICSKLGQGYTEDALINTGVTLNGLNRNEAKVAVWSAEWHFCPSYY
jgi:hypothetical protein